MSADGKKKLGTGLIVLGLLTIVGAVLWVLEEANGPGLGPPGTFAERRSYNQTKEAVHESFPLGFAVGIAGLGLAMAGSRIRSGGSPDAG